jgi:hypothetical protein
MTPLPTSAPLAAAPTGAPSLPTPIFGPSFDHPLGFDRLFQGVRTAVRDHLHLARWGLGLGLAPLPPEVGAYWPLTGNMIVLNEAHVRAMRETASPQEFNAFVFVVLAHEYLHALGYLGEREVRQVTADVARATFGPDHLVTEVASTDLWERFPFLRRAVSDRRDGLTIVTAFDRDATASYIR